MDSLYSALNATAADLVAYMHPYLLQARMSSIPSQAEARVVAEKLDEDLHVAGDLLGILKLILDKDEWRGLESIAPRIFTRKFRSDLHQVRDLRNRLAHANFSSAASPEAANRLLDFLTYSLYLASINAPTEKCSYANEAVKTQMATMLSNDDNTDRLSSPKPGGLPDQVSEKMNEWLATQEAFWSQQVSAILNELRENQRVSPSEARSLEIALENSRKQHEEYSTLLQEYKGELHSAVAGRKKATWVTVLMGVAIAIAGLTLYIQPIQTPEPAIATPKYEPRGNETNSPRVSISSLSDHIGRHVWIDDLRILSSDSFISSSGRHHLRFTAEDSSGNRVAGVFFEGLWDDSTQETLRSGVPLSLWGKLGTFSGKPSLEASKVNRFK